MHKHGLTDIAHSPSARPKSIGMAYCNCTTSPCSPAIGQPLAAGEGQMRSVELGCNHAISKPLVHCAPTILTCRLQLGIPAGRRQQRPPAATSYRQRGWKHSRIHLPCCGQHAQLRGCGLRPGACSVLGVSRGMCHFASSSDIGSSCMESPPRTGQAVVTLLICFLALARCSCRQNWHGQLGSGSFDSSSVPVQVVGEHSRFVSMCAGYAHTCGLLAGSKRIACFGKCMRLRNLLTLKQNFPITLEFSPLPRGWTARRSRFPSVVLCVLISVYRRWQLLPAGSGQH